MNELLEVSRAFEVKGRKSRRRNNIGQGKSPRTGKGWVERLSRKITRSDERAVTINSRKVIIEKIPPPQKP